MNREVIELLAVDAKLGDMQAFNTLYNHFLTPMRRYALLRVKDPMTSEDLVQNVWIKVGKRIHQLNNMALFQSWLYRALKWEILDWFKQQHHKANEDDVALDSLVGTDQLDLQSIVPMLLSLAETERDVVELHYLNGLSLIETALALDVPLGTVKSRLFRARNTLRTWLNEES